MFVYYQNLESLLRDNPNLEVEDFLFQSDSYIYESDDIPISEIISNIDKFKKIILYFRYKDTKKSTMAVISKYNKLAKLVIPEHCPYIWW